MQLQELAYRAKQQHIALHFSTEVEEWLAEAGLDAQFGARPLKRLIQNKIASIISTEILKEHLKPHDSATVNMIDEHIFITKDSAEFEKN